MYRFKKKINFFAMFRGSVVQFICIFHKQSGCKNVQILKNQLFLCIDDLQFNVFVINNPDPVPKLKENPDPKKKKKKTFGSTKLGSTISFSSYHISLIKIIYEDLHDVPCIQGNKILFSTKF